MKNEKMEFKAYALTHSISLLYAYGYLDEGAYKRISKKVSEDAEENKLKRIREVHER